MAWNGYTVIDMDAHIRERADRFFKDYIDPEYRGPFNRLMWLFASDWPHGDTAWPEAVQQTVDRPCLTESAKRKLLGENAMRLCPRLRA